MAIQYEVVTSVRTIQCSIIDDHVYFGVSILDTMRTVTSINSCCSYSRSAMMEQHFYLMVRMRFLALLTFVASD